MPSDSRIRTPERKPPAPGPAPDHLDHQPERFRLPPKLNPRRQQGALGQGFRRCEAQTVGGEIPDAASQPARVVQVRPLSILRRGGFQLQPHPCPGDQPVLPPLIPITIRPAVRSHAIVEIRHRRFAPSEFVQPHGSGCRQIPPSCPAPVPDRTVPSAPDPLPGIPAGSGPSGRQTPVCAKH